jgi:hypothetical protein
MLAGCRPRRNTVSRARRVRPGFELAQPGTGLLEPNVRSSGSASDFFEFGGLECALQV